MGEPALIIIAGPTASGKSAVALRLCERMGGEIISADSMQIYRGMDIGTAKPTREERARVRHHMIDVVGPEEPFSVARYREGALAAEVEIRARGKRPILCGGTGLYIDAITRTMAFAKEGDERLRAEFAGIAAMEGGRARLHEMLRAVDPQSAQRLHANDVRRVIRALEIYRTTGKTMSEHAALDAARTNRRPAHIFALDWPRESLYLRIDARVDQMVAHGLVGEVRRLLDAGLPVGGTSMQALGYKEIVRALAGESDLPTAVRLIKQGTRRYAKRQLTWLRGDERVQWLPAEGRQVDEIVDDIMARIVEGAS